MNKKKLGIIFAVVVLVVALVAVYFATRPETNTDMKTFTVMITHKDGSSKIVSLQSEAEYLGTVLAERRLIEYDEGPYGKYIKVADGEKAVFEEDGAYWAFYVDEEYAMLGVDQTPIEEGKTYKLVYTVDTGEY